MPKIILYIPHLKEFRNQSKICSSAYFYFVNSVDPMGKYQILYIYQLKAPSKTLWKSVGDIPTVLYGVGF